jgi:hypothetical protein
MAIERDLLRAADPAIAYRARLLLQGEDPRSPAMLALRRKLRSSKNARGILSHREKDGTSRAGPYQKWQGPHWALHSLTLISYPPGDQSLIPLRDQVYDWLFSPRHFEFPHTQIIPGQKERPRRCASQEGNAVLYLMELGLEDERTEKLVERLIDFQWPDGGWNCDKRPEARTSSFVETLIPLRALWRYGRERGHKGASAAAQRAAEFLLQRRLLFRLRDGAMVKIAWGGKVTEIHFPIQLYDVLFALQVMAEIGKIADPRCREALEILTSKQLPDGGFPREAPNARTADRVVSRGSFADWGPSGKRRSNPFVSIEALRVLGQAKKQ